MAQGNFEASHAVTAVWEGSWSNHSADRGGRTNWGITQATLSAYLGRPASADEIRNLTKVQAKAIFKKNFWNASACEGKARGVDLASYDYAVNSGPGRINKIYAGLVTNSLSAPALVKAICAERRGFFTNIISRNPSQAVFRKGWFNRVAAIEATAYSWALTASGLGPDQVRDILKREGKASSSVAKKAATKAKGAGGGAVVATGAGGAFQWEGVVFVLLLAVIAGGVAFVMARKSSIADTLAQAYEKVAGEINGN